jgi:osmotically inducible lipoprotein OsmB
MLTSRMWKYAAVLALLATPLGLAGCAETIGAGAGAYAGHELSHGNTAATIGGAAGGALIGHVLTH